MLRRHTTLGHGATEAHQRSHGPSTAAEYPRHVRHAAYSARASDRLTLPSLQESGALIPSRRLDRTLTDTTATPGYSLARLLADLPHSHIRTLIGVELFELVEAAADGALSSEALGEALEQIVDPKEWLQDSHLRLRLLRALPPDKGSELLGRFGVEAGRNPSATLESVAAKLSPAQLEDVARFFGMRSLARDVQSTATETSSTIKPSYGLFQHQRISAQAVVNVLGESRSVLLHMPTGSGKTRTAMHIVAAHLNAHESTLVCWLSQQPEVLEQAADAFVQAWHSLGNRDTCVHRLFGDHEIVLDSLTDGLVIGGFQKLTALESRDENALLSLGDRTTLVVVDEAHQAIAPTFNSVVRALSRKRRGTKLLGLTATPGRSWLDVEEDLRLSEFFGSRKIILQTPDERSPIDFLVDEGYLARPTFRHVNLQQSSKTTWSEGDDPITLLDNQRLLVEALEMLDRHQRIVIFAGSVAHARFLSWALKSKGVKANLIVADTPKAEREFAYHRFRQPGGPPSALVNYGVLTTGFDAPIASAAIIARPTKSLVLFSQMVGRVLRGPKANGTETAEILTTIDTRLPGFGSVADAFHNWEDVWDE